MIDKEPIKKIGIFRALQLGDLMCCVPAIRALKQAFPQASVHLIGLSGAAGFVNRFQKHFNRLIPFPGYPGLPEQHYNIWALPFFIKKMQLEKFDLLLQMQGNGTLVNPLIELFGARNTGGFYMENDYKPPSGLFIPYPDSIHEIRRHLLLMEHIGIQNTTNTDLEFPLNEKDFEELDQLHLGLEAGNYICIHPGSRGSWRQWPPEYFARLADHCMAQNKQVVITGTSEELPIVEAVKKQMNGQAVIAAGKTGLGAMGALIQNAFAVISNCTGVSHIAAALKKPGIIISMDGEPERWAPLHRSILYTHDWLTGPDYSKVKKALDKLLHGNRVKNIPAS